MTEADKSNRTFVFSDVYTRILQALGAHTQNELARALEIRQSTISDAKKRDSIPTDWLIKLYDKYGLNPDWLRYQEGPMYLKLAQEKVTEHVFPEQPVAFSALKSLLTSAPLPDEPYPLETLDFSTDSFHLNPLYEDTPTAMADHANAEQVEENVWHGITSPEDLTESALTETVVLPVFSTMYKGPVDQPCFVKKLEICLPRYFAMEDIHIFHIDTHTLAPAIQYGAFIGVDPKNRSLQSGQLYAFCMPHEGVIFRRPVQTKAFGTFILSLEGLPLPQTLWPIATLLECLLGRVAWTLQKT